MTWKVVHQVKSKRVAGCQARTKEMMWKIVHQVKSEKVAGCRARTEVMIKNKVTRRTYIGLINKADHPDHPDCQYQSSIISHNLLSLHFMLQFIQHTNSTNYSTKHC